MSLLTVLHTPSHCEANRFQWTLNLSYASRPRRGATTFSSKVYLNVRRRRLRFHACLVSRDEIGSTDLNIELRKEREMMDFVVERHRELDRGGKLHVPLDENGSKVSKFQEHAAMNMVGTKLGMIQPIFSAPTDRITSGWVILFILIGIVFDKIWSSNTSESPEIAVQSVAVPQVPPSLSLFVEKDVHRKESVEWVNMIIGKLWKVYRSAIEDRMVHLFQPVINDLEKPGYVQRVEVKEFSLGNEPLSVRTVDRRTSRCAHDLQYHVGIRYAGGASLLLLFSLKFGMVSVSVPVGLQDFDIDGELWVKLRLLLSEPWIEVVSWAFVSRPTIKFELSPFRLFNLMAIPFLSTFLNKLFTEDLPWQFVLPRKVLLDLEDEDALRPNNYHSNMGEIQAGINYAGELSVTLVYAQKLSSAFFWADPFVVLSVGNQLVRSKKNSQTTVLTPHDKPIWNQDFYMLVADPRKQKLCIQVKGSLGFADIDFGVGEVGLWTLQDTVPQRTVVKLRPSWGMFKRRICGEILLRLTYKAYIEDEADNITGADSVTVGAIKRGPSVSIVDIAPMHEERGLSYPGGLQIPIESEQLGGVMSYENDYAKSSERSELLKEHFFDDPAEDTSIPFHGFSILGGSFWFWFAIITGILALLTIGMSGFLNSFS